MHPCAASTFRRLDEPSRVPVMDRLAADLAAFLAEHERCGELATGAHGAGAGASVADVLVRGEDRAAGAAGKGDAP